MKTGKAEIILNVNIKADYYKVVFNAPHVSGAVLPGQFIHVQIAGLRDRILRRPFSVCDTSADGLLTVVYKVVGEGTKVLSELKTGAVCDVLGPLGTPYSLPMDDEYPVIAAGGYGSAATYILAKQTKRKGVLLLGAKTEKDLILADDYKQLGFDVKITTEDGSFGAKGFVTSLLKEYFEKNKNDRMKFYGCGPNPMMIAVAKMASQYGKKVELSMDYAMCCGVGACYACVVKIKDMESSNGWKYARTCREGPVFSSDLIFFE
jgi:dihydroorotate dehydrogenase electron transfer subunit